MPHIGASHSDNEQLDDDDLFAELEAEIENDDESVRERGAEILRQRMEQIKEINKGGHGQYTEIINEKEVIRTSASEARCVIHFYHTNFKRCETMDEHLAKLAPRFPATRFIRVFVENVPWLVEKLTIKVLPCVICFVQGIAKDRLIGFQELADAGDNFDTSHLQARLLISGVIIKTETVTQQKATQYSRSKSNMAATDDHDDVFDLDD